MSKPNYWRQIAFGCHQRFEFLQKARPGPWPILYVYPLLVTSVFSSSKRHINAITHVLIPIRPRNQNCLSKALRRRFPPGRALGVKLTRSQLELTLTSTLMLAQLELQLPRARTPAPAFSAEQIFTFTCALRFHFTFTHTHLFTT